MPTSWPSGLVSPESLTAPRTLHAFRHVPARAPSILPLRGRQATSSPGRLGSTSPERAVGGQAGLGPDERPAGGRGLRELVPSTGNMDPQTSQVLIAVAGTVLGALIGAGAAVVSEKLREGRERRAKHSEWRWDAHTDLLRSADRVVEARLVVGTTARSQRSLDEAVSDLGRAALRAKLVAAEGVLGWVNNLDRAALAVAFAEGDPDTEVAAYLETLHQAMHALRRDVGTEVGLPPERDASRPRT